MYVNKIMPILILFHILPDNTLTPWIYIIIYYILLPAYRKGKYINRGETRITQTEPKEVDNC
jgi:hypothetical protein